MDLKSLIRTPGEWLKAEGPESHIVVSSRVRLARNIAGHRFIPRMSDREKRALADTARKALHTLPGGRALSYFDMEEMPKIDRTLLLERHLISREHLEGEGARGVAIQEDETVSIMINEEDHLRLQSIRSGLQFQSAFETLDALDDDLSNELDFAYDETYGYLTACPTNVGTGLRVSVMLHLPALVMTRHIEKAFRSLHDLRLAVRGLYGEGTEAHGEFYQISNQITIGRSERTIIDDLRAAVDGLVAYEIRARQKLLKGEPHRLEDHVWRAYATLRHARVMNSTEAMKLLSAVRLGTHLAILPGLDLKTLNAIFIYSQPAHLQRLENRSLPAEERDIVRARYIRERLDEAEAKGRG